MKHIYGILGYFAVVYIATTECRSEVKGGVQRNAESTSNKGEEYDFIPYREGRLDIFDWTLFKTMSKRYSDNLLLSPISLKLALVLLFEGAGGETAHELASSLQLPSSIAATREKFSSILRSLQTPSASYVLNIGTRIYVDSNIRTSQRYGAIVKSSYNTDMISANLSDTQRIVGEINDWVSNITARNIDKIIEDDNNIKDSLMLIMNALYFKGTWNRRFFTPENTRLGKFYTNNNQTVDVPFMHSVNRFYFTESSRMDAKILRIPYQGHKFALYIVLPRTQNGIEQLVHEINPFLLSSEVWLAQESSVDVRIPKFKFQFASHLEPILRELGIRDIFDNSAILTGIQRAKRPSKHLIVTDIIQKAGIEVNENGTAAYVATEVEVGNKIEDETFHANRPFIFYIEDETTGTIIYIGKVTNPLDTSGSTASVVVPQPQKFGSNVPKTASKMGLTPDRNQLFSKDLLQALNRKFSRTNLVSSPASIKIALMMVMEGASDTIKSEIISILRLPDDDSLIREVTRRTLESLQRQENGTEIALASCLWVHETLHVLKSYKEILRSYYKGEIQNVNFLEPQNSARIIDDWTRQVTHNKISSSSIANIQSDTRLLLTSAIYFKGRWLKSFNKTKTRLQCFYTPTGECRNTPFMVHDSTYRYSRLSSIEAEVLEIPYSDGKTSMLAIMPLKQGKDPYLELLSRDLTTVSLSFILANLREDDFTVHLPKFVIENKLDLIPTLQDLGINSIFQHNANFTGIQSDQLLRLTNILQNVKIEVDEEGTSAAAVTEVGYEYLSSLSSDIRFDRPFLFMIVDTTTYTTLFFGRLVEP